VKKKRRGRCEEERKYDREELEEREEEQVNQKRKGGGSRRRERGHITKEGQEPIRWRKQEGHKAEGPVSLKGQREGVRGIVGYFRTRVGECGDGAMKWRVGAHRIMRSRAENLLWGAMTDPMPQYGGCMVRL